MKMKKLAVLSCSLLLSFMATTHAATPAPENKTAPQVPAKVPPQNINFTVSASNITVNHPNGQTIVSKQPQRIVVMDFGTLDTLEKLQLSQRVVAYPLNNLPTYLSTYKEGHYQNAGNMKEPDLATIQQVKPDLIVITGRQGKSYEQLTNIAPTINLGINAHDYLNSFIANNQLMGELLDKQITTENEIAKIKQKIVKSHEQAEKSDQKALVIMHNAGKLSAANSSQYATIIHDLAGIKRADSDTKPKRQMIDEAYLTTINPDIIFVVDRGAAIGQEAYKPELLEQVTTQPIKAIQNKRIIYLTPDLWYLSGGGLISLNKQLDEVMQ